ncbi:MAG: CerR family C-terminal domain-containing protein [Planctomycetota bacterium]
MTTDRADGREKLLNAALKLFAERGRDSVSLRDIAAEAGVTHGSVRYHFGTKENLYIAAVMRLGTHSERVFDGKPRDLPDTFSPEQARDYLRGFVRRFVAFQARAGADPLAAQGLLRAEISREGGPDPVFFERVIKPGHDHVKRLFALMLPDVQDDRTLEILAFNLIFQCVMIRIGRGIITRLFHAETLSPQIVDQISELIITVTLGGIGAVEER